MTDKSKDRPNITGADAMAYLAPELENLKAFCKGLKLYQSANVLGFLEKVVTLELADKNPAPKEK